MEPDRIQAIDTLTERGRLLRDQWRFEWPDDVQQAVHRLRFDALVPELPTIVAVVGGASSGKSTLFNNLLGGQSTSRITARGHTTLGPILAVHERRRSLIESLLGDGLLLPGCRPIEIELGEDTTGETHGLAVAFHTLDALGDVLLIDTPDFTSDASAKEGRRTLAMLPWFDRVLLVVDHERWFDRQSILEFRPQSVRFGQQRLVLFNRTREAALEDRDRDALSQQARRLGADSMVILEFRRGRGFCRFAPGTLDEVYSFLRDSPRDRHGDLLRHVGDAAHHALNQNEERRDRLSMLRASLEAAVARLLPSTHDCMMSLMTPDERERFAPVARVLRIHQTKQWLARGTHRIQQALKQVPLVGALLPEPSVEYGALSAANLDRRVMARAHYSEITNRQHDELRRLVRTSAFWHEMSRWTGLEPGETKPPTAEEHVDRLDAEVEGLDTSLKRWAAKVESELQGLNPHLGGAIGAGAVVLAVVLIAVPGPVTALTLVVAKGAVGGALTQLAAATGAGALFGRQIASFAGVVREKLLGSAEFNEVQRSAASYRAVIESAGGRAVDAAVEEASRFVLDPQEPLVAALGHLRDAGEISA